MAVGHPEVAGHSLDLRRIEPQNHKKVDLEHIRADQRLRRRHFRFFQNGRGESGAEWRVEIRRDRFQCEIVE